jgi:HSP20 family protein
MSLLNSILPTINRANGSASTASATRSTTKPRFQINETPDAYHVRVQLPGVARDGLSITAEENILTIQGERGWKRPEGWTSLYQESNTAPFELVLEHDNAVNLDNIHAELRDGVLTLNLPKAESLKPRKIAVA